MNELQELNKLRGQVTAMCMRILGRIGNQAMMHSTEELLRLAEDETLRLKGELAEAVKLLSEGRDHLRQLVALANTNNATKELLRYIGNTFNAFLQKHEKGAS